MIGLTSLPLPPGWAITTLENVITRDGIISDGDWVESKDQDPSGDVRLIQLADIGDGVFLNKSRRFLNSERAYGLRCTFLCPGDLLISRLGEPLGKSCIFPDIHAQSVTAVDILILRSGLEAAAQEWLMYCINSPFIRAVIAEQQSGTTRKRITGNKIKELPVRFPPLPEQARIVSRIEELFSDLDKAEESLRRAQSLLKRYRQSVLKAAVTGELTRAWREAHADKLESGEALLRRILKARREAWERTELEKMRTKGKSPKDDSWKKKYVEPQGPATTGLPELPEGWTWATVEMLAAYEKSSLRDGPFGSNLKSEHYVDDGPRVIRLQNVGDGQFIDEQAHISEAHYAKLKTHCVHGGDIIIAALGSPLPRACVVPDNVGPAINKADCVRYRINPEFTIIDTALCALNSIIIRNHIAKIVHGIGRPRINLAEIKAIPIPVASLAEQAVVADTVASIFSNITALEKELTVSLEVVKQLRQSILKAAFSGKLVPQDPSDEPAAVLLQRIAAARAAQTAQAVKRTAPQAPRQARTSAKTSASSDALATARKAAGLTQTQLAKRTGLNPAYISQMESGKRSITPEQADSLASALDVEPESLT